MNRLNDLFSFSQVRVGLFAKKLSLKDDFKIAEMVCVCAVLPTVELLRLVKDQLALKLQDVPNEQYMVVENLGLTAIDVKAPDGLMIRITLTSDLIHDKVAAQRLDKGLSRDACIRALDGLIKFQWYKVNAAKYRPIAIVIKLCRHLAKREPVWAAFNK